jgi:bacterioferritin (cytochrome b1)
VRAERDGAATAPGQEEFVRAFVARRASGPADGDAPWRAHRLLGKLSPRWHMQELAKFDQAKVIDVLNERLVFERAGVKLYDRILEAIRASGDENVARMLQEMEGHRSEEKEHEEWLEAQIRGLGGNAHAETEKSRLVTRESKGIEEVVMSGAPLPHLLHALLAAELVDNAGWDLLVQLADEAGDREAKREFKRRLHEEEDHLLFIRRAVEKLSFREVLGEDVKMPRHTGLGIGT